MAAILAINGGPPIRTRQWPKWPVWNRNTLKSLHRVLLKGRWTISGPYTGYPAIEQEFARRFASFNRCKYCVPTANGSSSLLIALESLNVGCGDEVIVPGLTWVATASSILNANARPVFVDIDPDSLSMSVNDLRKNITSKTRAIILVHLYCSVNDMDEISKIARDLKIPIIEDCSHVHGSEWRHRRVGTLGALGCFSMQQSKVLTSGEGGAVITNKLELFLRLEQLRSDGRRFVRRPEIGRMELIASGKIMGGNYCLSEFHSAVLMDQLGRLERQNAIREANAKYLDAKLSRLGGLTPVRRFGQVNKQSYYQYAVKYNPESFCRRPLSVVCKALEAELGLQFARTYPPMNQNPLFRPRSKRRYTWTAKHLQSKITLQGAKSVHRNFITFHHSALLGERRDMDDIVFAFAKIQRDSGQLPWSVAQ